MNQEILKSAKFDVKIKTSTIDIDSKGLSYEAAALLVSSTVDNNIDDEWIREAASKVIPNFGFTSYGNGQNTFDISAYKPFIKGTKKHTCPRRSEGPQYDKLNEDTWDMRGDDPCCSYCGSIKPSHVLELIKQRGFSIIGNTDKGYKRYLSRPEVPNASFGGIKFYTMHFSEEEVKEYNELLELHNQCKK